MWPNPPAKLFECVHFICSCLDIYFRVSFSQLLNQRKDFREQDFSGRRNRISSGHLPPTKGGNVFKETQSNNQGSASNVLFKSYVFQDIEKEMHSFASYVVIQIHNMLSCTLAEDSETFFVFCCNRKTIYTPKERRNRRVVFDARFTCFHKYQNSCHTVSSAQESSVWICFIDTESEVLSFEADWFWKAENLSFLSKLCCVARVFVTNSFPSLCSRLMRTRTESPKSAWCVQHNGIVVIVLPKFEVVLVTSHQKSTWCIFED